MRPDLPSGTITFLFTDVEGSTRLLHSLGTEAYADALAEHRRLIRDACASHGGVEVDTQGDAFFFAFPTAPGALAAAGEMTEVLSSGPIQVRIGLHTGAPLLTEEGYVGDDVHFAARVAASAHGGQVVLSAATAALIEPSGSEPQALPLLDLGEHRLKDIAGPVSILQLGESSFPPLKTISNTNLPRPASSFVGREAELAEVLARIEAGARLVTLTGPGGSGKTRLALEAAASLVPEYKAGVFWVGLAALRDPALVTETISQTLGAKDGLVEHIGERELMLLLDNLEQVIEAAPELSSLLQSCPNLTLLVTSRELLRVQGEVEYAVPPLAEPEAVSLFCERAQTERSEEIAELCARLDSLPLAVELAAARVKALSPTQILERLSQRLDLLKGGRDVDPRQQTLRATIEWSYDLLSPEEQLLFARLSVFAGGCMLEAAEDVCDADLDTLQSLVEKSLLRFTYERYWMLETIREYAGERLGERDKELRRRHASHYLDLARRAALAFHGAGQEASLDRLDVERDNLRLVLDWGFGNGDRSVALELAAELAWYWQLRSYLGEGATWLATSDAASTGAAVGLRAALLQGRGQLDYYRGDPALALGHLEGAVELWRQVGDQRRLAESLTYVGIAAGDSERPELARRAGEEAVAVAKGLGEPWIQGFTLWGLGANLVLGRCGDPDPEAAQDLLRQSVDLLRAARDGWALGASLFYLGSITVEAGDIREARPLVEEAAALFRRTGDQWRLRFALRLLADVADGEGKTDKARRLRREAEAIQQELATR